ncbi:response regulator [Sedimentisphaera salicampi]|uniref:Response regulator rcp1 n=1 Tax=Sedimentisphaera salicampi TaxID=1941349 RepID=A0A1W6LP91_9BACT|nr:response regulator [Sedimentisphaera salicampi]ARN57552.1 Response regulator rcp1 [Sedimentisphaera salicampi]OXU14414.1 Response regulator rcp1 [Sedimentisphaera salicampi]
MGRKVNILLAEDNPADKMLFEIGINKSSLDAQIFWVTDGVQVMDFLHNAGDFADSPKPDIVILDLNMPRKDGREVVKEIKRNKLTEKIITIVFTTSDADADRQVCLKAGADRFIIKPLEFDGITKIVKEIESIWLSSQADAGNV